MENYKGASDNQTDEQKAKNYKLEEFVSSIQPVVWVERPYATLYPIRNQNGSSQCVCMTLATEMGIIAKQKYGEFIDFSSSFPYQQRGGSYGGCTSSDVYSVFPKLGNVFESVMPSQNLHEDEALAVERKNYYKDLALPFSIKRIALPIDFETVVSTIQATGKGVMVWFRFSNAEWTDIPQVLPQPTTSGHSVTAVDFILKNGKKYLVIQDSWGLQYAMNGYRLISEEYFQERCFLASYLKTFQTLNINEDTPRPIFDGSVKSLQEILIYEGFLGVGLNTGFLGNLTKSALIKFQEKVKIIPALGVFGPITKAYLFDNYK